jgi:AraC-like DNA-binding protein
VVARTGKELTGMKQEIPQYKLDDHYISVHRKQEPVSTFGYSQLDSRLRIKDFELYSSEGLTSSIGPLRSEFYRIGLTLRGSCDVQLGLEHYKHEPGTVNCTYPNQIFSKSNISSDAFGYYLMFNPPFLEPLVPAGRIVEEFPFFHYAGTAFFQMGAAVGRMEELLLRINDELWEDRAEKVTVIRLHLYLMMLEMKRSYKDQGLGSYEGIPESTALVVRFRKLVGQHYLEKQQVADYANLLYVTPNHLNRTIKDVTGRTASAHISEMILLEAKSLLLYTDLSMSEIAWRLRFSEPSSFHRFFKKETDHTPLEYRSSAQAENA